MSGSLMAMQGLGGTGTGMSNPQGGLPAGLLQMLMAQQGGGGQQQPNPVAAMGPQMPGSAGNPQGNGMAPQLPGAAMQQHPMMGQNPQAQMMPQQQPQQTQGALITQAWVPGSAVTDDCFFRADDIPDTNILPGMMVFLFACFSAGCPAIDSYRVNVDGSPIAVAKAPFISKLAQALLSHGALAVIGHIDRAYKYGFVDTSGTSQVQAFRTPLEVLMQGNSAGLAADSFSSTEGTLSVTIQRSGATLAAPALVRMHIACDDARNYIVLGDPATRLRVPSAD